MRFFVFLFILQFVYADVEFGVLDKYTNHHVFVGTGFRRGLNFDCAYRAKFSEIYFLDEEEIFVEHSQLEIPAIFENEPKLRRFLRKYGVYHGDPSRQLIDLIKEINEPITFLLSSYIPDPDFPEMKNPVLEELDQIQKHPIHTHTILIDFISHVDLERVKKKLLEINPHYKFRYEMGGHQHQTENAVFVAYLRGNPRYLRM